MARELPRHLTDLLNRLCETSRAFIKSYKDKEPRIRAIVDELSEIADKIKERQNKTYKEIVTGAAIVASGIGLLVPLSLGVSPLGEGAGKTGVAGGVAILGASAAAAAGGALIWSAHTNKKVTETEMLKRVGELGKEFTIIAALHKNVLEDIKKASDDLEQQSSLLRTAAGEQAKITLSDIAAFEELQQINLTDDATQRLFITKSVSQCEKAFRDLAEMKSKLEDFEEN